jgi:S-ribosylhomocysteine lyase
MKQIASFTIDHMKLLRGVYVSRKDKIGNEIITTFDLRMTRPNFDPVMGTGEMHTIEHLAATYLRNHPVYADKTVYFGPMGCRTGFYLLLGGDYTSRDIIPLMIEMYEFIREFTGDIPGATAENCGNYSDMNLDIAKFNAKKFLDEVLYQIDEEHLNYPA